MYYPEEVVDEVCAKNDIVDIISRYVRLQKRGSSYFGLCPFHNEKTPSFSVSASKQMYYCFGCGAGGNVITFLMEYESYTFQEALVKLASRAGVRLPEKEQGGAAKKDNQLRAGILEVNKLAAKYYYYQLKADAGRPAYAYLREKRGLTDQTILRFGLGYSGGEKDSLYRYLKGKGYGDEFLKETGLFTFGEWGTRDRFRNRVMFPIMNINNRVIGFGGRVMDDGQPKYLNSPETKVFDKGQTLYGLNYARSSKSGELLLCEGYLDVISMHQAGFSGAVASLGTAFTGMHAAILKRYTSDVVLTYDSDGAGQKAALRAIPMLRGVGLSTRVINMSPYKDPDEFIKNEGGEAFQARIHDAKNAFLFEIDVLKNGYDMSDPDQKTRFYHETAKKLLVFREPLERENYIQAVAKEHEIPVAELRSLVNRLGLSLGGDSAVGYRATQISLHPEQEGRKAAQDAQASGLLQEVPSSVRMQGKRNGESLDRAQGLLLAWLIEDPGLFGRIRGIITPEDFSSGLFRRIAVSVFEACEAGLVKPANILSHFINDEDEYRRVAKLFNAHPAVPPDLKERSKAVTEVVRKVKRESINVRIKETTQIGQMQGLIKEQAALKDLWIALDEG